VTLTDALTTPAAPVDPAAWRRAIDGLPRVLTGLAATSGAGARRIGPHDVRTAMDAVGGRSADRAFAWSARTSQRLLGLAALESLLFGSARSPAEAVREVVAQAAQGNGQGTGLERWLAGLAPAGRAAAGAAAVTWATRLWCGLDWDALPTPLAIGRDLWWESPQTSLLTLRSRSDVHCGVGQLVVLTGSRRASARHELSLVTLVEALKAEDGRPPGPVVGWWPDSGHLVRVDSEPRVLDMGIAAVAAVLRTARQEAAA
jgi:hypothetical protein